MPRLSQKERSRRENISAGMRAYWRDVRSIADVPGWRVKEARSRYREVIKTAETEGVGLQRAAELLKAEIIFDQPDPEEFAFLLSMNRPELANAGEGNFLVSGSLWIDDVQHSYSVQFEGAADPGRWWAQCHAALRAELKSLLSMQAAKYDRAAMTVTRIERV